MRCRRGRCLFGVGKRLFQPLTIKRLQPRRCRSAFSDVPIPLVKVFGRCMHVHTPPQSHSMTQGLHQQHSYDTLIDAKLSYLPWSPSAESTLPLGSCHPGYRHRHAFHQKRTYDRPYAFVWTFRGIILSHLAPVPPSCLLVLGIDSGTQLSASDKQISADGRYC